MIDLYSWLPGRRIWGDARMGPGRIQEDRRSRATGTSGTGQDSATGDLCGGDSGGAPGRALLR